MLDRIKKIKEIAAQKGADAAIICDIKNVRYFSGFTGTSAYLLLTLDGNFFVTDSRYTEQAQIECPLYEIVNIKDDKVRKIKAEIKTAAFEDATISYKDFLEFTREYESLVPISDEICDLRSVKSDDEIKNIKAAQKITDAAFSRLIDFAKHGMTEIEIALELEYFMKKNGAENLSFDTIIASGARGALAHGTPTGRKIENGDLVVVDFGCKVNGYCSDMTRTFGVGDISDDKVKIYNTVKEAQSAALSYLKEGVLASDVHQVAQGIIDREYPDTFGHGLGHSLGLDIHEFPALSPKCNTLLKSGHIITVEPGIYISGLCGVRIEDLVLITKNGIDDFTTSTKELLII